VPDVCIILPEDFPHRENTEKHRIDLYLNAACMEKVLSHNDTESRQSEDVLYNCHCESIPIESGGVAISTFIASNWPVIMFHALA
jgi:hypothetical protein